MAYRLEVSESPEDALRRIADEQTARAIASLSARTPIEIENGVHDARKRCKKLRALIRLVRPAMEDVYERANRRFRDAARCVSEHRDAHARRDVFEKLVEAHPELTPEHGLREARAWLTADATRHTRALVDDPSPMLRATSLIRDGLLDLADASIDDSFGPIGAGVEKTYDRARARLEDAETARTTETFHELRKRVKYSRYHVRLLHRAAPSVLEPRRESLHELSDALGDAHDLAELVVTIRRAPITSDEKEAITTLADGMRVELERRSLRLARRLFAESGEAYVARLERYYETWRAGGAELETGGLEDITAS
jgi:CHAD domain-containing protein